SLPVAPPVPRTVGNEYLLTLAKRAWCISPFQFFSDTAQLNGDMLSQPVGLLFEFRRPNFVLGKRVIASVGEEGVSNRVAPIKTRSLVSCALVRNDYRPCHARSAFQTRDIEPSLEEVVHFFLAVLRGDVYGATNRQKQCGLLDFFLEGRPEEVESAQ